jgi:transposase
MSKPYSKDLRSRVVAATAKGMSCHQACEVFEVSLSSAIRWTKQFRETGTLSALPMGGDRRSRLTEERDWLLERIAAEPDVTLATLRQELAERGRTVGYATLWRFFDKEKISFKKKSPALRARQA